MARYRISFEIELPGPDNRDHYKLSNPIDYFLNVFDLDTMVREGTIFNPKAETINQSPKQTWTSEIKRDDYDDNDHDNP